MYSVVQVILIKKLWYLYNCYEYYDLIYFFYKFIIKINTISLFIGDHFRHNVNNNTRPPFCLILLKRLAFILLGLIGLALFFPIYPIIFAILVPGRICKKNYWIRYSRGCCELCSIIVITILLFPISLVLSIIPGICCIKCILDWSRFILWLFMKIYYIKYWSKTMCYNIFI